MKQVHYSSIKVKPFGTNSFEGAGVTKEQMTWLSPLRLREACNLIVEPTAPDPKLGAKFLTDLLDQYQCFVTSSKLKSVYTTWSLLFPISKNVSFQATMHDSSDMFRLGAGQDFQTPVAGSYISAAKLSAM